MPAAFHANDILAVAGGGKGVEWVWAGLEVSILKLNSSPSLKAQEPDGDRL